MVGNNLFLCGRNYRALALVTGDNSFNGFLQIFLLHHVTMHFYSSQRTLIDNVGKLCTAGSGCCPRQSAIVDIVCHMHITCMNLQDSLTALKIRQLNRNTAIKTSRTQQRLVQRFRTVGSCQNNYTLAAVKAVHFAQQLIQSLLAFIIAAELTVITAFADGIDFIDKYYARCLFLRLLEQITHTGSTHADKHFYKFTAADAEERHLSFACYRTRQQGFTCTRRANQQSTLRHISTDILVLAGIMQKINQLHQRFFGLILTCYIGKAFACLRFHIDLGIALAEAHGVAAHALAHEVHK